MSNWLNRFNPFKSKAVSVTQRKFAAARVDRTTSSWLFNNASINDELKSDLDLLRNRARDLAKNNDYGKKYAALCVNNIVGPSGFHLQVRGMENGQPDTLGNDAVERAFEDWTQQCDVTGHLSFADFCRALVNSLPSDGEFLVRTIMGENAGNDYGYALQLLDVDRLDTRYNIAQTSTGNTIIMGVEIDKFRRPVNYYLRPLSGEQNGNKKHEIIPANEIIHGYITEFAEQVRGIPWMAAGMLSIHHLGEFLQSALLAARKGANTLGFIVNPDGTQESTDDTITLSVPVEFDTLPPGYDVRQYESRYPDAMIGEFCKTYDRKIANAFQVSYSSMANDLSEVNFSSIRSGVIEERDQWMVKQDWLIKSLLRRIYTQWLQAALLRSKITLPNNSAIPASRLSKFTPHQWQGRRWQWVDPLKDIQYAVAAIKAGVLSPQMVASQNGVDLEDVLRDIKRFEDMVANQQINTINYGQEPTTPATDSATAATNPTANNI